MAGIGFPSDVEILALVDVFRELIEEQLQEVIDILTSGDSVGNT